MNGTEQRQRHVAVATAERKIDDVQTLLLQVAADLVTDRAAVETRLISLEHEVAALSKAINNERTHRLTLADEQRTYVDRADRELIAYVNAFLSRSLWRRLRWIVRGV